MLPLISKPTGFLRVVKHSMKLGVLMTVILAILVYKQIATKESQGGAEYLECLWVLFSMTVILIMSMLFIAWLVIK